MALDQSALTDLLDALRAGGDLDFMRRDAARAQALIELDANEAIGAARYERTETRTTHRNGTRSRLLSTKAGDVELAIPKLRYGSFFPALLSLAGRIDRALWAVIMEAFVHGVSTARSTTSWPRWGIDAGVPKSQVSICADLAVGEPLCRELQRPRARRAAQHRGVRHAPRGPGRGRGLAHRVQQLPTPLVPRRPDPRGVCRAMDHQPASTPLTAGPLNGPPRRGERQCFGVHRQSASQSEAWVAARQTPLRADADSRRTVRVVHSAFPASWFETPVG